jgi:hypothetical protein
MQIWKKRSANAHITFGWSRATRMARLMLIGSQLSEKSWAHLTVHSFGGKDGKAKEST